MGLIFLDIGVYLLTRVKGIAGRYEASHNMLTIGLPHTSS